MITITDIALQHIAKLRERLEAPVKGIRVRAVARSRLRAEYALSFVPQEEPESPADAVQTFGGIDIYVDAESAPYVEDATIDLVLRLLGSALEVAAPLRKWDTPDGRVAEKIQRIIEEEVNPSLASHGGGANLIDFRDGIAFLELTGGCQGCSQADSTMKEGIEASIRNNVPEVRELRDVTQHADGTNPFYQ